MTSEWKARGVSAEELAAAAWRKSVRSGSSGSCVEAATMDATVGVRDSKNPHGPALTFGSPAWKAFLGAIRDIPAGSDI